MIECRGSSEEHDVPLLRILTDRGSEYCGNRETHEYVLYLDLENIDHTRTKTEHPQTNGICERFHQTIKNEFYASAFRRKLYRSIEELQEDVDAWVSSYNTERTHPHILSRDEVAETNALLIIVIPTDVLAKRGSE